MGEGDQSLMSQLKYKTTVELLRPRLHSGLKRGEQNQIICVRVADPFSSGD